MSQITEQIEIEWGMGARLAYRRANAPCRGETAEFNNMVDHLHDLKNVQRHVEND